MLDKHVPLLRFLWSSAPPSATPSAASSDDENYTFLIPSPLDCVDVRLPFSITNCATISSAVWRLRVARVGLAMPRTGAPAGRGRGNAYLASWAATCLMDSSYGVASGDGSITGVLSCGLLGEIEVALFASRSGGITGLQPALLASGGESSAVACLRIKEPAGPLRG